MKDLFFITIAATFFSLAPLCTRAQDSTVSASASVAKPKDSPQFIENIELVPQAPAGRNEYAGGETAGSPQEIKELVKPEKKGGKSNTANIRTTTTVTSSYEDAYLENCSSLQFKYAILTDREVEQIKDTALYHFIDTWMGAPYEYGGTTKDGIDCSSFTAKLLSEIFSLSIPRTAKEQYDACVRVHKSDLKEGDLVFFTTMGKRHGISHVGVYLGNNYFVHSSTSSGVMISSLDDDYFSARFVSGGRLN